MTYDWFKSKFTAADLDGKSVSFRIPLEDGIIAQGEGLFDARQHPQKPLIAVAIVQTQMVGKVVSKCRILIPVEGAENIVRNPPGSKSEFAVIAA